jgi:hypothetical protein
VGGARPLVVATRPTVHFPDANTTDDLLVTTLSGSSVIDLSVGLSCSADHTDIVVLFDCASYVIGDYGPKSVTVLSDLKRSAWFSQMA